MTRELSPRVLTWGRMTMCEFPEARSRPDDPDQPSSGGTPPGSHGSLELEADGRLPGRGSGGLDGTAVGCRRRDDGGPRYRTAPL